MLHDSLPAFEDGVRSRQLLKDEVPSNVEWGRTPWYICVCRYLAEDSISHPLLIQSPLPELLLGRQVVEQKLHGGMTLLTTYTALEVTPQAVDKHHALSRSVLEYLL